VALESGSAPLGRPGMTKGISLQTAVSTYKDILI
jgi:hypothetical protein